jgi:hypothetical protein
MLLLDQTFASLHHLGTALRSCWSAGLPYTSLAPCSSANRNDNCNWEGHLIPRVSSTSAVVETSSVSLHPSAPPTRFPQTVCPPLASEEARSRFVSRSGRLGSVPTRRHGIEESILITDHIVRSIIRQHVDLSPCSTAPCSSG